MTTPASGKAPTVGRAHRAVRVGTNTTTGQPVYRTARWGDLLRLWLRVRRSEAP